MYKYFKTISEVKDFILISNLLIIQNKQNQIFLEEKVIVEFGLDFRSWDNFVVFNDKEDNANFYSLVTKNNIIKNSVSVTNNKRETLFGITNNNKLVEFEISNSTINSFEYHILYNWENVMKIENSKILIWDKRKIKLFKIQLQFWELDLQNELSLQNEIKIQQLFDVCDNLLWVWLTNYQLVGIDVDSSSIIHNYFPLHNLMQTGLVYVNHLKYNKQENCIYFFEQGYFIQIQLATQQTQLLWHNAEYDTGLSVIHDDYVYFVGGKRQSFFKNQIGVFDRKLNDVIWQTQIKINGYESIQQIEVASNKIYVRTTEGKLHIFEKEKVINLKESSK